MTLRRLAVHVLRIALVATLGACQSPFSRACLQPEDCERHPVNGPSAGVLLSGPAAGVLLNGPAADVLLSGPSALRGVNGPSALEDAEVRR